MCIRDRFYVDRMDSGCLTYSRFAVSDENGPYAVLPDGRWDIDASFDEKAGKCGLLEIDGGVELCWGITEYGRHDYTVSYDIGGLAGAYSDADGFNYRFIDTDQSIFPTSASVTVRMEDGTPLTDETCDIWAFGFDGQIQFEDGVIRAWTETPLEGSRYMTVMVRLEKGCLLPEMCIRDRYQTEDGLTKIDVRMENETVWLTQAQMAELFQRERSGITKHIKNVFAEGEVDEKSNVKNVHIANSDKPVAYYSLDVIISVGYRVKSLRGTQFRIWANSCLFYTSIVKPQCPRNVTAAKKFH